MAFGSSQAQTALRLITKSGQSISFKRTVVGATGAVNLVTGEVDSSVDDGLLEWAGKGVRSGEYTGINFENMGDSLKEAYLAGKTMNLLVAAAELERAPAAGDIVILADATEWKVLGVSQLNPAGIPIIYFVGAVQL
jgi:hypothetical protein